MKRVVQLGYLEDEMLYRELDPFFEQLVGTELTVNLENACTFYSYGRSMLPKNCIDGETLKITAYSKTERVFHCRKPIGRRWMAFSFPVPFEYFILPDWITVTQKLLQ